jgi:predicted CXXCH cytochrome family protein
MKLKKQNQRNYFICSLLAALTLLSYSSMAQEGNSCATCHKSVVDFKEKHQAAESCDNCHQSSGTQHPKEGEKGFDLASAVPALCYTCHEAKNSLSTKHPPVDSGECLTCHNPHGSKYKAILTDNSTDLCKTCHDIAPGIAKSVHKPFSDGKCVVCHDPHQSNQAKLLKSDSRTLCLTCHNKVIKTKDKVLDNIAMLIKDGNTVHPALEGDGCVTCHKGHFSDNNYLLNGVFATGSYQANPKEAFALCFTCHDAGITETEKSTTLTGFRNGDSNLHFVHLKSPKSRSCAICHNVHGSPNNHMINSETAFGNWRMKLNYNSSEKGGSCQPGCHKQLEYNRETPVSY